MLFRSRRFAVDHSDLQFAGARDDSDGEQQRIAGQEEAYQETAFGEYNQEEE